jgi:transcriptional regulator
VHIPKHFDQSEVPAIQELILRNPLGALVTAGPRGISATHIPFELSPISGPYGSLLGHVARENPVWSEVPESSDVLVIFQGPNAYISPSWYPSKKKHGKVVPTWNYVVAHAYGRMRAKIDRSWVRSHIERLTAREEMGFSHPWSVDDAPAEFAEKLLAAVVGIEIEITRFEAKWKVSQNRPQEDRAGVAEGLRKQGTSEAESMASYVEDAKS